MALSAGAAQAWDLLLRGAVGGVLLFHLVHLALPGPRAAGRAVLAVFTLSLVAYLFCQRADLLQLLPRPLAIGTLALCVSSTAWLWLSARALFTDLGTPPALLLGAALGLVGLGLAANLPRLLALLSGMPDPGPSVLGSAHAVAMLGFTAAAVWEVLRGWREDLVEPRRAARRWVALGIGVYASVALVVELAVRDRPVGLLLPALHVLGIGGVALALAVLVARRSLDVILGPPGASTPGPDTPPPRPPAAAATAAAAMPTAMPTATPTADPPAATATGNGAAPRAEPSAALQRLLRAMADEHAYRREGLTLADLARQLGLAEAALRRLINQELGYRNFNDFLHHYRLEEAAARLAGEDRPILTIALECGYGSIGPFNRAFRQRFGMTPTEHRAAARLRRQHPA